MSSRSRRPARSSRAFCSWSRVQRHAGRAAAVAPRSRPGSPPPEYRRHPSHSQRRRGSARARSSTGDPSSAVVVIVAVGPEQLEHLLEGRAVRGADRVRDQAGHEARVRVRAAPRRRVGALRRRDRGRPPRRWPPTARPGTSPGRRCRSSAGRTCPCTGRVEQRAQVLVDVGLAGRARRAPAGSSRSPTSGAEHGLHHRLGDRPPDRVHDRRAGVVVGAVVVGVEARRGRGAPSRRAAATTCASSAFGAGPVCSTWLTDGPHRARARPRWRPGSSRRRRRRAARSRREPVEQLDPVDRAVGLVVAVHEARARTGCSSSAAGRPGRPMSWGCSSSAQEALPLVAGRCRASAAGGRGPARARGSWPDEKYAVVVAATRRPS